MVLVNPPPPDLALDLLTPYYACDELLSNARILVFHGKANFKTNHDQAHVFTPAGLQSYPKLAVSPDAPAVEALPSVDQGDEICRALAVCLHKYFQELPAVVRSTWRLQRENHEDLRAAPELFSAHHAAILAGKMVKVENGEEVLKDVMRALAEQSLSWLDMDVVLPPGSLAGPQRHGRESAVSEEEEDDSANARYGIYAPLVKLFGEPAFLPTSKLKRAPSKPTGLNRSKQFLRQQKENLRREMCELLDTEENYVGKMYDLLHSVAEDFRAKARNKAPSSTSPSEDALKGLFPPSLDEILESNNGFLEAIRKTLEETENDAIQDIETAGNAPYIVLRNEMSEPIDVTGTLAFARCMIEWFPRFADCYADYIQAHSKFGQYLRVFLKETGSSFSKRVQETGEQRLMSMLIEPVQRLPRYSLYIDNIIKQLPMRHPALKTLLKARDMISEICSRDSPANQQSTTVARLLQLVPSWPQSFRPRGRLVTAMDVIELPPPYREELEVKGASSCILLLFTDYLVVLIKSKNKTVSARGLTAEIDSPTIPDPSETNQTTFASQLIFLQYMKLSNVWFTEVGDGARLQMLHSDESSQAAGTTHSLNATSVCMFHLAGAYEKKASRWLEETVKARVEGRFSEAERENPKWEVRCLHGELNLFSAFFEANDDQQSERQGESARVHIVIDPSKGNRVPDVGEDDIEIVASITPAGGDYYQIEVKGISGFLFRDRAALADVLPVLNKRVGNLLQLRSQIRNPALTAALLLRNREVLKRLKIEVEEEENLCSYDRSQRSGSASPVKMLSNLFGGSLKGEPGSPRKLQRAPVSLGEVPRLGSPAGSVSSFKMPSRPTSRDDLGKTNPPVSAEDSQTNLNDTFASYCLALQARKGNIVGKVIRNRASADETAVNELYNSLLEEPTNHELAANASVDVLFSAFEKFVKIAWKNEVGPVMPIHTQNKIQRQVESDSSYPGDFEEIVMKCTGELSPHNQDALRASVKLLSELLSGTSNDGDRGILTAAFAEILGEGRPHDFIPLLDRFIEDQDNIFGRPTSSGSATPSQGSMGSRYRGQASNTGSLSSHTSSLKKRFGFGSLRRENSKHESDENTAKSMWRTLSKTNRAGERGHGHTASLSKATPLIRSNSTDADQRLSPKRPISRDRPTVLGAFPFEDTPSHSARSFGPPLGTIGEGHEVPKKKKRRSSVGDVRELYGSQAKDTTSTTWSPKTPRRIGHTDQREQTASPQTPGHDNKKPSGIPNPARFPPNKKENSPLPTLPRPLPLPRPKTAHEADGSGIFSIQSRTLPRPRTAHGPMKPPAPPSKDDEVTVTANLPRPLVRAKRSDTISTPPTIFQTRKGSISNIPTLHRPTSSIPSIIRDSPSLTRERPKTSHGAETTSDSPEKSQDTEGENKENNSSGPALGAPFVPAGKTTRRLRLQNTQKLRERLQNEKRAIAEEQEKTTAIKAEMDRMKTEEQQQLESSPSRASPSRASPSRPSPSRGYTDPPSTPLRIQRLSSTRRDSNFTMTSLYQSLEVRQSAIETALAHLNSEHERTQQLLSGSLTVHENRAREFERLLKEQQGEVEELYATLNEEFGRQVERLRGGDVVEELKRLLGETREEVLVREREVGRLRRENVGLKSLLRDA